MGVQQAGDPPRPGAGERSSIGAGRPGGGVRASRFCHLCGRGLSGRYYRYANDLVVCVACQTSRPHCERCDVPLADSDIARARANPDRPRLCAACDRSAPRCAACGLPIAATWYTFEELLPQAAVRHFCAACVQSRPRCDLCRAPVAPGTRPLADGQYRCTLCASEMVLDPAGVGAIYREAYTAFAQVVDAPLAVPPRLEVVGRVRMGEIRRAYEHAEPPPQGGESAQGSGSAQPANRHILGFYVRSGSSSTIYVETGLPRGLLLGTLAHELGHAWQAERAPAVRDPLLCEGFAEWVAHHVLLVRGLHPIAARATRRDDIYGRGLRHFLAIEQTVGRSAVFAAATGTPVVLPASSRYTRP